jgi:hypothetical protein
VKSVIDAGFVLVDAMREIAGDSDIENTGAAGHDVNGIESPFAHAVEDCTAWAKEPRNGNQDWNIPGDPSPKRSASG